MSKIYLDQMLFVFGKLSVLVASKCPMSKLFLIGDCISIRYCPYLEKYIADIVQFERKKDDGQTKKKSNCPNTST